MKIILLIKSRVLHLPLYAILVAMLLYTSGVKAQFYTTGSNPNSVKWNYIKSKNYKVIYPQEIDSLARRYMWLMESEREKVMAGMGTSPKPIDVLLQPYTTQSNGLVVWAPKRVELYTQPPANRGYSQNWERELALHESRHVGQMTHFTKGVFKPLGWLLGEQITGLGVGVYAPKWLLEGDAVIAETELSNSGRGRNATFLEYYRAAFMSGEYRSWEKWRYGSLKLYTPDHYAMGYLLNSAIRVKSDNYMAVGELLDGYVKRFYNPGVQSATLKKIAGVKQTDLLDDCIDVYSRFWNNNLEYRGEFTNPIELKHKTNSYYYEYTNLVEVGKDSLVYIRHSKDNLSELVMLAQDERFLKENETGEKLLRIMSSSADALEVKGKTLYWIETVSDVRWSKRVYNILYSYNMESGKIKKLSEKSSFNNPVLSDCGEFLSVIEYPVTGGSNLVVLNSESGEQVASIPAPYEGQFTESAWMGDSVYALAITESGLGLFSISIDEVFGRDVTAGNGNISVGEGWKRVIKEQHKSISGLSADDDWLYFESDMNGVNNIYFFNPKTEELRRKTNARFAAHEPYYSNGKLYYSNLQLHGMGPVYTEDDYAANIISSGEKSARGNVNEPYIENGELKNDYEFRVAEILSEQADEYFAENGIGNNLSGKGEKEVKGYQAKRYRKGAHLFKFHSWAPVYYNIDRIMNMSYDNFYELVDVGATAYSQNTLGTAVTMLGYSYRDGHHAAHASFEYSGLYPVFRFSADYNVTDRYKYRVEEKDDKKELVEESDGKPLLEVSALAYVPIDLSSNGWQRGLVPQVRWKYENNAFYSNKGRDYVNSQKVTYGVQYYQVHEMSAAEIFPEWGFGVVAKGAFAPGGKDVYAQALSGYGYFYLPGVWNCQGLRLSVAYQKQMGDNKMRYIDNLVDMPRGYSDYYGTEYCKFSADYAIPVNFNGLDLGWLAYIKRLQIIPFADIAWVKNSVGKRNINSYGCDFLVDAIVFHIGAPVSFGVRYARINDNGDKNYIGFLASISMF